MAITAKKILLQGNNIVVTDEDGSILLAGPSLTTYTHPSCSHENIIYINTQATARDEHARNFPIDVTLITEPPPPGPTWGRDQLLQKLTDDYIGKLNVTLLNPTDLSNVESLLSDIKTFAQGIEENTSGLEAKLDTINTSITNGFSVNHADLIAVISELQLLDANTNNLETQLIQIISNTTGLATEATQVQNKALLTQIRDSITGELPNSSNIASYVSQEKVFSYAGNITLVAAGANNNILLLKNPIGSGKYIYLFEALCGTTITNVSVNAKLFSEPTVTQNGTAKTPMNNKVGSSVVSVMELYQAPTTSATGNELRNVVNGQNNNSPKIFADTNVIVMPGKSVLLTGNPSSNNRDAAFYIIYIELPIP